MNRQNREESGQNGASVRWTRSHVAASWGSWPTGGSPGNGEAIGISSGHRRDLLDREGGWTLIELIGALAVLAVLAGLLVPAIRSEMDRTARVLEVRQLDRLAEAIRQEVRRSGSIPAWVDLPAWIAPSLGWRTGDVSTNGRGVTRALVTDPEWQTGRGTNRSLPYRQTSAGGEPPVKARMLLVSSLGEALPARWVDPGLTPPSPAEFDAVWQVQPGAIPAGWSWAGSGDDLVVARVDLQDEFQPIALHNPGPASPQVAVSTNPSVSLGPGRLEAWFLRGTALRLMNETGNVQSVETIQAPAAWIFEAGKWYRVAAWNRLPEAPAGRDFAELADRLRRGPVNPHAPQDSPARWIEASSEFFAAFQVWAATGYSQSLADDSALVLARERMRLAVADLLAGP